MVKSRSRLVAALVAIMALGVLGVGFCTFTESSDRREVHTDRGLEVSRTTLDHVAEVSEGLAVERLQSDSPAPRPVAEVPQLTHIEDGELRIRSRDQDGHPAIGVQVRIAKSYSDLASGISAASNEDGACTIRLSGDPRAYWVGAYGPTWITHVVPPREFDPDSPVLVEELEVLLHEPKLLRVLCRSLQGAPLSNVALTIHQALEPPSLTGESEPVISTGQVLETDDSGEAALHIDPRAHLMIQAERHDLVRQEVEVHPEAGDQLKIAMPRILVSAFEHPCKSSRWRHLPVSWGPARAFRTIGVTVPSRMTKEEERRARESLDAKLQESTCVWVFAAEASDFVGDRKLEIRSLDTWTTLEPIESRMVIWFAPLDEFSSAMIARAQGVTRELQGCVIAVSFAEDSLAALPESTWTLRSKEAPSRIYSPMTLPAERKISDPSRGLVYEFEVPCGVYEVSPRGLSSERILGFDAKSVDASLPERHEVVVSLIRSGFRIVRPSAVDTYGRALDAYTVSAVGPFSTGRSYRRGQVKEPIFVSDGAKWDLKVQALGFETRTVPLVVNAANGHELAPVIVMKSLQ